jgi:sensor c-di-GMP phosphodiesterase-like protein
MRSLTDLLVRWPRLSSSVAALIVGLASLLIFAGLLAWQQLEQMQIRQNAAAARAWAIMDDSKALLQLLNQRHSQPSCDEQSLTMFRADIFTTAAQSEIGVLGENGELLCTSLVGKLAQPIAASGTELSLVADSGQIYLVAYNLPLVVGSGRFSGTIVSQGRFNTVVNPKAMDALFAMGQDVTRVVLPEGGSFPIHISPNLSEKWRSRLSKDFSIGVSGLQFDWHELAFLSTQSVPETHFVVQSVLTLDEFVYHHRSGLVWAALVSLFVGLLTYGAAAPLFHSWGALEHRISKLLCAENLICMYQPMVDLASGKPTGCDVLMRLRDADDILYPDQVLPAIVKRGLTWELDQLVVRTALLELGKGLPEKHKLNVAFNVFPDNISCERLCSLFEGELHDTLRSHRFNFELAVTEKICQGAILKELSFLKQAGFLVSVDDFGTGYSNLGSVKNLSPNFLKIDKSFVFDMEDASVRSSLIPEIVSIARAVNTALIAKGIENEAQRKLLQAYGVEFGQGYLFGKPMAIDDFLAFMGGVEIDDSQQLPSTSSLS